MTNQLPGVTINVETCLACGKPHEYIPVAFDDNSDNTVYYKCPQLGFTVEYQLKVDVGVEPSVIL